MPMQEDNEAAGYELDNISITRAENGFSIRISKCKDNAEGYKDYDDETYVAKTVGEVQQRIAEELKEYAMSGDEVGRPQRMYRSMGRPERDMGA